jgi:uncharacterized OsmC-like protein
VDGIEVLYEGGDRFAIRIRDHDVVVDQPTDAGGADLGPTPTELFVASLAACVGFYAERYLRRHGLPAEGLQVMPTYRMSIEPPARVGEIDLAVSVPVELSTKQRAVLAAVVDHCTVHNSLLQSPSIRIALVQPAVAA